MKLIYFLLFFLNISIGFAQPFLPFDQPINYTTNNVQSHTRAFRLYNPCHEWTNLIIDVNTLSAPDIIQILDYYTDSVLYDSGWIPYSVNYPNSADGFAYITNNGIQYLSDSIIPGFSLSGWSTDGYIRFDIVTNLDFFKINIIPSIASSGYYKIINPNLETNIPQIYTHVDRYFCELPENQIDTVYYSYECTDSIVIYHNYEFDYGVENYDIWICKGDSLYLENPLADEYPDVTVKWSDGIIEDHWVYHLSESQTFYLKYYFPDCIKISYFNIEVNDEEYDLLLDEYTIYENSTFTLNFSEYQSFISALYLNGTEIDFLYNTKIFNDQILQLEIIDMHGCKHFDQSHIITYKRKENIYFPNAFSPNNDGINDYYEIFFEDDYILKINKVLIFDRWGGIVYEEENILQLKWDGKNCNVGTYVLLLDILNFEGKNEQYKAEIHLIK